MQAEELQGEQDPSRPGAVWGGALGVDRAGRGLSELVPSRQVAEL